MLGKKIKDLNLRLLRFNNQLDLFPASFDRHKCIFFHIPKAAGTSVCMSLFGYQVGHLTFDKLYNSNPRKTLAYYKFAFVRNPWARLVSAYCFLKDGGMNQTDKAWMEKNLVDYKDFNEFVTGWVNEENINSYVHFIPQYKFISDKNGIIRADFVGKTENFQKDVEVVLSAIGFKAEFTNENKSKHNIYTDYYDEQTKEIVAKVYEKDIELFGYSFND